MNCSNKHKKFIVTPEIRKTSEIKYHNDNAPGKRYVFLDKKKLPETTIYSIVRIVKNIRETEDYMEEHAHDCDSKFLFLGDEEDMTGLKAEITLAGEKHIIESPAAVFIPKGLDHSVKLLEGSGKFINTVLNGDYNDATK